MNAPSQLYHHHSCVHLFLTSEFYANKVHVNINDTYVLFNFRCDLTTRCLPKIDGLFTCQPAPLGKCVIKKKSSLHIILLYFLKSAVQMMTARQDTSVAAHFLSMAVTITTILVP